MITKEQIEKKIWDYFDKHNVATHEDEGGVPCADEIAQYMYDAIKNLKAEAINEFAKRLKEKAYIQKPYGTTQIVEVYEINHLVTEMTEGEQ